MNKFIFALGVIGVSLGAPIYAEQHAGTVDTFKTEHVDPVNAATHEDKDATHLDIKVIDSEGREIVPEVSE